jgi:hypothetical protein
MSPRYRIVAHHVSHLFPDVVSEPMTFLRAEEAASRLPAALPSVGARGWTVNVEPASARPARARHLDHMKG